MIEQIEDTTDKKTYNREYRKAHRTEIRKNLHRCRMKQKLRKDFIVAMEELVPQIRELLY